VQANCLLCERAILKAACSTRWSLLRVLVLTILLLLLQLLSGRQQGYLVHVNGRDVNIGKSTCSLFCFTLARAMLADTIDCTCNDQLAGQMMPPGNITALIPDPFSCAASPVMCSVNEVAFTMYKKHMKPAMVAVVITVMCLLGLLSLISGTHARLVTELRTSAPISRSSSAEADLRISTSEDDSSNGYKAATDAKVAV